MAKKTFLILLILVTNFLISDLWADGKNNYDSSAIISAQSNRQTTIYQLPQIKNLRRPVPPQLIWLLDWQSYASSTKIDRRGILFTYRDLKANTVSIAGNFSGWNRISMERNNYGIFYIVVPIRELEEGERPNVYTYRFNVDGIWTHDPLQMSKEDGTGGRMSIFYLDKDLPNRLAGPRVLPEKRPSELRLVEFAVHESKLLSRTRLNRIENVSIVGDFNRWNPESDLLSRGNDGVYRIRLKLLPGHYMYRIVVDGRWILDPLNQEVSYHSGLKETYSRIDVN